MRHNLLFLAVAVAALGTATDSLAAGKSKSGHNFKGNVELQYRTNNNISVAPSSGNGFDFADLSEFGADEEDAGAEGDDEEDEDGGDDAFDDVLDADMDEDEIEEEDAIDEDGDGIDDIIDPNADTLVDSQTRVTAKFGLGHKYGFGSGSTSWNNGFKLASDTHSGRSELNKLNWAVTTGFEFAPKKSKHSFKPSLSYVTLEKDGNEFVSTFVVSLGYEYEVSKRVGLGVTYNYQDKDITNPDSPDSRIDTLALAANFKATDNDIFKLKYAPKVEDSTVVTRDTDAWGWEATYTRKLPWEMALGFGFKFDSVDHKNLTPNRQDDNTTYAINLAKDFGKQLTIEAGYETRDRDSNIPSKDASNDSVYIGGTWKF